MSEHQHGCVDYREVLPAIAAGAPLPLALRGEGLHHAEECAACRHTLAALRATWAALAPDVHRDPEPSARLDPLVARAVHLARASESSVTAIPIVVDRGEPPPRRMRPALRAALAIGAVAALAAGLWLRASWPTLFGTPADRAAAAASGLSPEDALVAVEAELRDHPDDAELWRLLGTYGAYAGDADALCRGFVRYLALRPAAPDRTNVQEMTADRLASLGRSGLCVPGAATPAPAPAPPAAAPVPARP
jgi:hypothetical protein